MTICFICLLSFDNHWNINNFNREPREIINIYQTTVICYIKDKVNFFSINTIVIYRYSIKYLLIIILQLIILHKINENKTNGT